MRRVRSFRDRSPGPPRAGSPPLPPGPPPPYLPGRNPPARGKKGGAAQAVLARPPHVVGPRSLAFLVDHHPELRGEHDLLPATVEGEAEKFFALRSAIDVGRVDEVDPDLESGVDDRPRGLRVDPAAEV